MISVKMYLNENIYFDFLYYYCLKIFSLHEEFSEILS
jgi:hypothetical protein